MSIVDWLEPPERQVICESPRIRRMDGFLPPEVCRWLVDKARGQLARARIYSTDGSGGAVANARTNSETDFNIVQSDLVLVLVRARIAAATGLPPAVMELTKVLHYSVGEQFDLHYDYIDPAVAGSPRNSRPAASALRRS